MADNRISFGLSERARRALRFLAADWDTTQQEVIERLILEAGPKWLPATNPAATMAYVDQVGWRR